jgi:hypothetical protein
MFGFEYYFYLHLVSWTFLQIHITGLKFNKDFFEYRNWNFISHIWNLIAHGKCGTNTNTQAIEMKRSLPTKTNKIPSDILSPQAWTVLLIIVLTDYNGMYCSSKWYSHVSDIMVTGLWLTVKLVECWTPLNISVIIYRGSQFYWWRKTEYLEKPPQVAEV